MSFKCKLHKSNEGFIDETNTWVCWLCYKEPMNELPYFAVGNKFYFKSNSVISRVQGEEFTVTSLEEDAEYITFNLTRDDGSSEVCNMYNSKERYPSREKFMDIWGIDKIV